MREDPQLLARSSLVLFGALTLQLGLVDDLRLLDVHPDLLLAVGVATGVVWGAARGAIVGFVAGLLTELFLSSRFGLVGLSYGVAGYATGFLSDGIARSSRWIDAALVAGGSALGVMLYAVIGALFGEGTLADPDLWRIVLVVSLSAAVLSPVATAVCRWTGAAAPRVRPAR